MAKKNGLQDTSENVTRSFTKGLNKDSDPSYVQEGMWTHARNAVNNSAEGDIGSLSNEVSNYLCITAGITIPTFYGATKLYIIGTIYLFSDKWLIFTAAHDSSGSPVMSEIGLLDADRCIYRPIVQDACLNFDRRHLISGASREKEDCTWQAYFADGLNPDRYINVGDPKEWISLDDFTWVTMASMSAGAYNINANYYANIANPTYRILWPGVQWIENCTPFTPPTTTPDCIECVQENKLDCDKLRLARLMTTPCLNLKLGTSGGTLKNGTYFALIAYSIKGQPVTNYFSQSNYQFVYSVNDLEGSLDLEVSADFENFDEFQLVIVQAVNEGTVAKQIGFYSTRTKRITLDAIKNDLVTIPLEILPIQTPVFEKSDQITEVNDYLLKVGPTSKFDFNYQPFANMIRAKWTSVEYPADYYVKGGNKTSYLRDEVYPFYIRWVYDTGDKSASYHIPGRAPRNFNIPGGASFMEDAPNYNGINTLNFDPTNPGSPNNDKVFEVFNTASQNGAIPGTIPDTTYNPATGQYVLPDGGIVKAVGDMGYWESTEIYPNDQADIWNPSAHCWTGFAGNSGLFDLCGKPIRHHKFPENSLSDQALHFDPNASFGTLNSVPTIRIMGVYFENISFPKDNNGDDIPGIVGYEILRGSREGNKTIIAKGMINNFRTYDIRTGSTDAAKGRKGLYPNHPFNCIIPEYNQTTTPGDHNFQYNDPFIYIPDPNDTNPYDPGSGAVNQNIPSDIISFHSPDTMFRVPYLETTELKLYGYLQGSSYQQFVEPNGHPKFQLLNNSAFWLAILIGLGEAIISLVGKRTINEPSSTYNRLFGPKIEERDGGSTVNTLTPGTLTWVVAGGGGTSGTSGNIDTSQSGGNTDPNESQEYTDQTEAPNDPETYTNVDNSYVGDPDPSNTNPNTLNGFYNSYFGSFSSWNQAFTGGEDDLINNFRLWNSDIGFTPGGTWVGPSLQKEFTGNDYLPDAVQTAFNVLGALNKLVFYFTQSVDATLNLFYATIPFRQYALQMQAHGFYDGFSRQLTDNILKRFKIDTSFYMRDNIQDVPVYQNTTGTYNRYSINNLKRSDAVVIRTKTGPRANVAFPEGLNIGPRLLDIDKSLVTVGQLNQEGEDEKDLPFSKPIASHYGALKVRIRNQYGQLQSVKQIVITPCEQKLSNYIVLQNTPYVCSPAPTPQNPTPINETYIVKYLDKSPIFFGGDTYINRYTEKNNMFFFYDWLFGQPDGFEYNYLLRQMIPRPRFWVNSTKYDVSELAPTNWLAPTAGLGTGITPGRYYRLDHNGYNYANDNNGVYPGVLTLSVRNSYFYTATSSIRDFFVESDVLVDFRKAGVEQWEKYYDVNTYTDLPTLLDMDPQNITKGNYYRYDYSLSVSKLYNQYFSAGNLQSRYYDPKVAKLCYTYYPDRIIYSLPQQQESVKDSWFIYLANNYKEFKSQISGVKSINKSGIFITFKNDSPLMYQGVDTLETDLGTKVTIGDGGLFSQPQQSVVNADKSYEYGSSQDRLSVISTPAGIFYMSANQGKIFSYGQGLLELSQAGMKWWFVLFLPYKLLEDFPDYPYQSNPVSGIGCQAVFDNNDSVAYFCKKDYKLRTTDPQTGESLVGRVAYVPVLLRKQNKTVGDYFTLDGAGKYELGDPRLFEDASWTISYDPKSQMWISFHDWHPDLVIPTKDFFMTTKRNGVWTHNAICNNFCNFYGTNYPFEIEFPMITGQTVMTIRSIEYILECYRRIPGNCVDQFHVLDFNFDKAVIFNSEQVSGYLNLNLFPKNNVTLSLQYPKLAAGAQSFDILFSKEENKYRFNQFWDITRDRGEFPIGSTYPPTGPVIPGTTLLQGNYADENMWITAPNGYDKILNPANLNYAKPELQRKKFRHYLNFMNLRKDISGDVNMIFKINNNKNQYSPR